MGARPVTCRIFIVFHHALFAQGIRSLLRGRCTIQVVGMESDEARALAAVGVLRPDVVIIEEPDAGVQSPILSAILQQHPAGRVVALDMDHNFATTYERQRIATAQPADLFKAIRGGMRNRGDPGSTGALKSPIAGRTRDGRAPVSLRRRGGAR